MSADIPTSRILVRPQYWRRTRPILSGDAAADKPFGFRGVSSQINHGMAYRTRVLAQKAYPDSPTVPFFSTAVNLTYAFLLYQNVWRYIGEGVTVIEAFIDCEQTMAYLDTNLGSGGVGTQTTRAPGPLVVTYVTAGGAALNWVTLQVKATVGNTCNIYRCIIRERVLTALT